MVIQANIVLNLINSDLVHKIQSENQRSLKKNNIYISVSGGQYMKSLKFTDLIVVSLFIIGLLVGFIQSKNTHENTMVAEKPKLVSLIEP